MLNLLRRLFAVRSPSRFGMTAREFEECGRLMQEGFEEGFKSVHEKCTAFEHDTVKSIEAIINEVEE